MDMLELGSSNAAVVEYEVEGARPRKLAERLWKEMSGT